MGVGVDVGMGVGVDGGMGVGVDVGMGVGVDVWPVCYSNLMLPWNVNSWVKFIIAVRRVAAQGIGMDSERNNYLAGCLRSEVLSEAPSTNSLQS